LTVLIELYNIQNKPSEILEEIRVLVSDKIEKIKNKIEQVETFIKNKPGLNRTRRFF
jgi:ribosome-associated translation inhibitor RaiA